MKFLFPWSAKAKQAEPRPTESVWLDDLGPGDIAIDCGANVGKITVAMAETGAIVHAFEPNPHAFARLKEVTAAYPNVICHPKAVGAENGQVRLFMHENANEDPLYWSTGSSMLAFKGNVNREDYVEVECVDLDAFIHSLGQPVKLLKMDVEGVECAILKKLIDTGGIHQIGRLYCEMHDKKIEALRQPSDEIRELVRRHHLHHVDLNWI